MKWALATQIFCASDLMVRETTMAGRNQEGETGPGNAGLFWSFMGGCVAGLSQTVVIIPTENIKVKLQVGSCIDMTNTDITPPLHPFAKKGYNYVSTRKYQVKNPSIIPHHKPLWLANKRWEKEEWGRGLFFPSG